MFIQYVRDGVPRREIFSKLSWSGMVALELMSEIGLRSLIRSANRQAHCSRKHQYLSAGP